MHFLVTTIFNKRNLSSYTSSAPGHSPGFWFGGAKGLWKPETAASVKLADLPRAKRKEKAETTKLRPLRDSLTWKNILQAYKNLSRLTKPRRYEKKRAITIQLLLYDPRQILQAFFSKFLIFFPKN